MKSKLSFISLLIIFFFMCHGYTNSQEVFWTSIAGGAGPDNDKGKRVVSDNYGNVYASGTTRSYQCSFMTKTLTTNGTNDIWIVKYDQSGNEVWILQLGGPNDDIETYESVGGMVADTMHNRIFISGTFFMNMALPDTLLQGPGLTFFLLCMDYAGNIIWAQTATGSEFGEVRAFDITCDAVGNVYVSGCNQVPLNFNGTSIPPGGFLAKYDPEGNVVWAENKFRFFSLYPTPFYPYTEAPPYTLAHWNSHLLVNGIIQNDTVVIDTATIITSSGFASYLASFKLSGELEWIIPIGWPKSNSGGQIGVSNSGFYYVTGTFRDFGVFGTDTIVTNTIAQDCFLVKVSHSGDVIWADHINATVMASGQGLVVDHQGNAYMSGVFSGSATFGNTQVTAGSDSDMFLAKYSTDSDCIGIVHYSAGGIPGLALDPMQNVCLTGWFNDSLTIGSETFHTQGYTDIFTSKCSPITSTKETPAGPDNTLLIYANPNTGKCNITIPEEFRHEENLTLYIYDNQGKLIQQASLEQTTGETTYRLDIRAQAAGVYNAVLTNGRKSYTGRIVFEGRN